MLNLGILELENLGFKVKAPSNPGRKLWYLAGNDDERLSEIRGALEDDDVACLFCARGGYGIGRLLERLEISWFTQARKIVVGFSDATALLNFLALKCGIPSIHGPMPAQDMRKGSAAFDSTLLLKLLGAEEPAGEMKPKGLETLRAGREEGVLVGGCMSVLCSLIGTPYEPDLDGKVLLLEDRAEKPYRIDRMLTQMKMAGWFEKLKGVVFGEMPDCLQHPDQGYDLQDVVMERLAGTKFPVVYNFPAGHTKSIHLPLPLGVRVDLDAHRGALTILEPLVEGSAQPGS